MLVSVGGLTVPPLSTCEDFNTLQNSLQKSQRVFPNEPFLDTMLIETAEHMVKFQSSNIAQDILTNMQAALKEDTLPKAKMDRLAALLADEPQVSLPPESEPVLDKFMKHCQAWVNTQLEALVVDEASGVGEADVLNLMNKMVKVFPKVDSSGGFQTFNVVLAAALHCRDRYKEVLAVAAKGGLTEVLLVGLARKYSSLAKELEKERSKSMFGDSSAVRSFAVAAQSSLKELSTTHLDGIRAQCVEAMATLQPISGGHLEGGRCWLDGLDDATAAWASLEAHYAATLANFDMANLTAALDRCTVLYKTFNTAAVNLGCASEFVDGMAALIKTATITKHTARLMNAYVTTPDDLQPLRTLTRLVVSECAPQNISIVDFHRCLQQRMKTAIRLEHMG